MIRDSPSGHTNGNRGKGDHLMRYNTSDNDKKARDNQARREVKNIRREEELKAGKHQYSKKTDHL
ncbi:Uncharacterised protein [Bacillus freudenreichii]|nr:Uncharacterised protein [Bacillus freudenreichii]